MPAKTDMPVNRLSSMIDSQSKLIIRLYERWLDEREYEDIDQYGDVLKKQLPAGFTLTKMTKRPFGFKFAYEGANYWLKCAARGNSLTIAVERC